MERIVCLALIAICLGIFPGLIKGQHIIKALPRWMMSSHAQFMMPRAPVDRFLDGHDWGYLVEAQYRINYNKPMMAGLYFSEVGLSKYVLKYTQSTSTGDVRIREKANTRRLEGGLTAGVYPEVNWLFQPYVQGRFGLALFQSSSILTDRSSRETIERINEFARVVPSYGLDLGVHIVPNIWFIRGDVRIGLVGNPSVSFMALDEENKGTTGYPIDYFRQYTSAGRWLKVSAGLSVLF